ERGAPIRGMMFSPGGRYLATRAGKEVLQVWDTRTGRNRPECQLEGNYDASLFSTDDRFMAWSEGSRIHLRDLTTGKETAQLEGELDFRQQLAFLRGSQILACWGKDNKLALWDTSKGTLIRTVAACLGDRRDSRFMPTPDGGALVYYP